MTKTITVNCFLHGTIKSSNSKEVLQSNILGSLNATGTRFTMETMQVHISLMHAIRF